LCGNKYFVIFLRQFASLINAGFPAAESMNTLSRETIHSKLRRTITALGKNMEKGSTLSESLSVLSAFFSPLFISLVRAGEKGGKLDTALNRFADFLETDLIFQKKIRRVMTYPFIILAIATAITGFMISCISPIYLYLFDPWYYYLTVPTKIFLFFINTAKNPYILHPVIIFIIVFTVIFKNYVINMTAKKVRDKIKLCLPFFGPLNRKIAISRFCRILALLLENDIPLMEALDIAGKSCSNEFITEKIASVKESIDTDKNIAIPLAGAGIFSPMVIQMIIAGEESGNLYDAFQEISDTYKNEVEFILEERGKILGSIILVGIFFIVGYTLLSFMPFYSWSYCGCH